MKKKILNFVVDILLISAAFALTDHIMLNVLHSERIFLEVIVYVILYGALFAAKRLAIDVWKKRS